MALALKPLKEEAIRLHIETGKGASAIAREPNFVGKTTRTTILMWLREYKASQTQPPKAS